MDNYFENSVKQWWMPLIAGIVFLILGVWVLATPVASYLALSFLFIAGFAIAGILSIVHALSNRNRLAHWGWTLVSGLLDLFIAVLLISSPGLTITILPIYIGFLLLFRSIMGIGFSTHLRQIGAHYWGWILFLSILGIIFSFLMIWNPVFGGLSIIIYTAFALLTIGVSQIGMALGLKRLKNRIEK